MGLEEALTLMNSVWEWAAANYYSVAIVSIPIAAAAAVFWCNAIGSRNLPPGPIQWPIVGSLLSVGFQYRHRTFAELAKRYGPLMHLRLGASDILVISSPELAMEVLKTKDAEWSSRPLGSAGKYIGFDFHSLNFSPSGPHWRHLRKICATQLFSPGRIKAQARIRREELLRVVDHIFSASQRGEAINLRNECDSVIVNTITRMLEWEIRYNIVLGAAQGLAYLHHDCLPCIVHRDIKANNILLGTRYEPYIADSGLAKLLESSDFTKSSTHVAGSYGYIAPEYGYTMKITEKSDVYSYGVMLLEVLTGKQPIDPSFRDGMHIVDWVKETLQHNKDAVEALDPRLQGRPDSQIQEMLQALGTALLCVNSNPEERPTMKDVAALLKEIKHDSDDAGKLKQTQTAPDQQYSTGARRNSKEPALQIYSNMSSELTRSSSHCSPIYSSTSSSKLNLH